MNKRFAGNIPVMLILLISLLFAKLQFNKRFSSGTDICMNICSDGRGFYAWLPAIFIYNDYTFSFFETVELKAAPCGGAKGGCLQEYRSEIYGRNFNKYYPGASFMMLPFFTVAHFITKWFTNDPANGYSTVYFIMMGFSGIFYYFLGMLFFLKVLGKIGLNTLQKSLTVLLVTFGSNIMYYAIDKPTYSHIYSFALIAAFIYYIFCLKERFSVKYLVAISFLAGWIFIARPVNIFIVIMLPFILSDNFKSLLDSFKEKPGRYLFVLPGLVMPLILFSIYKIATGHFFIYSYGNEGFDFLHPYMLSFLFHYDNGLFLYTPLLLMPLLLLPVWYKPENKKMFIGILVILTIIIYIYSSWWCWWFGYSFGSRNMLDFLPLFGILTGLSLKQAKIRKYYFMIPVYCLCCGLTMLLYNQKNHGYMNDIPITDYRAAIINGLGIK